MPTQLTSLCACRQVDADKHREIGNRFDVKGFPTILYFARGKPVESHQPCVLPLLAPCITKQHSSTLLNMAPARAHEL